MPKRISDRAAQANLVNRSPLTRLDKFFKTGTVVSVDPITRTAQINVMPDYIDNTGAPINITASYTPQIPVNINDTVTLAQDSHSPHGTRIVSATLGNPNGTQDLTVVGGSIEVKDGSGSPDVVNCKRIVFPSGTVTNDSTDSATVAIVPLEVTTPGATPDIHNVSKIEFDNGTVTDLGGGVARVTNSGGGGGGGGAGLGVVNVPLLIISPGGSYNSISGSNGIPYELTFGVGEIGLNNDNLKSKSNLTNAIQARILLNFHQCFGACSLVAEYSSDGGSNWHFLDGSSGPVISFSGTSIVYQFVDSGWFTLTSGAKADVWLRLRVTGSPITCGEIVLEASFNTGGAVGFQHNDTAVATEASIDFEDGGGYTFGLSDDSANGRVKVSLNGPTALPPNGSAGGDLSGTYPNPSVHKIDGVVVDNTTDPPTDGQVLAYNNSESNWEPKTISTGAAAPIPAMMYWDSAGFGVAAASGSTPVEILTGAAGGATRQKVDLTNATQARLIANVSTAGAGTPALFVEYFNGTSWVALGTGNSIVIGSGLIVGSWFTIASGALGDVTLRFSMDGGNGISVTTFWHITLEVK